MSKMADFAAELEDLRSENAALHSRLEAVEQERDEAVTALRELKRVVNDILLPKCREGGGSMDAIVWIDLDCVFSKVDRVLTPTPEVSDDNR